MRDFTEDGRGELSVDDWLGGGGAEGEERSSIAKHQTLPKIQITREIQVNKTCYNRRKRENQITTLGGVKFKSTEGTVPERLTVGRNVVTISFHHDDQVCLLRVEDDVSEKKKAVTRGERVGEGPSSFAS